jgi:hypothetical protein
LPARCFDDVCTHAACHRSSTLSGKCGASIGCTPAGGVSVEVHVTQNPQFTMDTSTTILSNSLQGKIGKPIIIGYNRESYGMRTMGAMVILLEADTSGPGGA